MAKCKSPTIAFTPEGHGSSAFRVLGLGKPSGARAKAAYCPHLSPGLVLVHDKENAHNDKQRPSYDE